MEGLDAPVLFTLKGPDWSITLTERAWRRCEFMKGMMKLHQTPEIMNQATHMTPAVMAKVKEWLEHYESKDPLQIKAPLASHHLKDSVSEWDEKFIDMPPPDVLRLAFVANYLGIHALCELACAKMANQHETISFNELLAPFGVPECPADKIFEVQEQYPEFFACFKPE